MLSRSVYTLLLSAVVLSFTATEGRADVFPVTNPFWGDVGTPETLAWAIDQANRRVGADVIEILLDRGTRIDINAATPLLLPGVGSSFISEIRDTLTINGNGGVLWGEPSFVTSGGLVKDKYEVSKLVGSDVLAQEAFSFTYVAPGVNLTVNDLSADGVNGFVKLAPDAVASLTDVAVRNTVPYGHAPQSVVGAASGAVASLNRVVMDRINMLEEPLPGAEYAWVGAVAGENATLNMMSNEASPQTDEL